MGIDSASDAPVQEEDVPSMISDNSMSIEARKHNLPPDLLQIFANVEAGKNSLFLPDAVLCLFTLWAGKIQTPAILYEYGEDYPGMSRIAQLRKEYLKENPQVIATSDPSTSRLGTSRAGSIP